MKYGAQTIGIIGIRGAFGRWLESFFRAEGFTVIGSDIGSPLTNIEVVRMADVVIFAVRLSQMVPVIRSLTAYSRKGQLWLDVGSRKENIVRAMFRSRAEVVGMHPLFAPPEGTDWNSQTLVISGMRLTRWRDWFGTFVTSTGAKVVRAEPDWHDKAMVCTQNMPQAVLLALAMALAASPCSTDDLLTFSTASSRKVFALIANMLANTPEVYADIQTYSREDIGALDWLIFSLNRIRELASEGKSGDLVTVLERLRAAYGKEFIDAGKRGFVQ